MNLFLFPKRKRFKPDSNKPTNKPTKCIHVNNSAASDYKKLTASLSVNRFPLAKLNVC